MTIPTQPYSPVFVACKAAVLVLACVLAVHAPSAPAATFCVSNSVQLDDALDSFVDGEDTTIRLVQGSYLLRAVAFEDDAELAVVGGYTDASCQFRQLDPSLTVLQPALSDSLDVSAENLNLESLTFRGYGGYVALRADEAALPPSGHLSIGRVRFEGPARRGNVLRGEHVLVSQVLAQHSGTAGAVAIFDGRCALAVLGPAGDDESVVVQHSTIVNSPNRGLCINPQTTDDDEFALHVDNNVLYGSSVDLEIGGTSRQVIRNNMIAGFLTALPPAVPGASGNNLASDPQFVNAGADDYRLQITSPAIDSGRTAPQSGLPQFDIVGATRWVGGAPDRGAYESTVDGAQVLVVTSTGDDGAIGTLRWAINQANANPSYSVIRFNIPGACPRPIVLGAELPGITTPVGIDGYSQPGSHPNTLDGGLFGMATDAQICVWITSSGTNYGLRVPPGSNGRLGVSGLTLGNFLQAAIAIEAGSGSAIVGNEIRAPEPIGIFVGGTATGTQIGGADPWQTNVIRSRIGYGVALNPPSSGTRVENNLIGIEAGGNSVVSGNTIGIGVSASDNVIVGNAIAGASIGVHVVGDRNAVRGNVFGRKVGGGVCLPPNCDFDLANGSHGVLFQGAATSNSVESNTIANSGGHGICATGGQRNFFVANRIWNSGALGIDLGDDGIDPGDNDAAPGAANRPNRGINSPVLVFARGGARSGRAAGGLLTTNGRYFLQAYASNDCAHGGQAQWLVGTAAVDITNAPAGGNGSVLFNMPIVTRNPQPALPGKAITVSVSEISAAGYGQSSELSTCATYVDDTIFTDDFE